jgi:hypothetical protein
LPHVLCLPARSARVAQNRGCEQEVFLNHSFLAGQRRAGQRLATRARPSFPASGSCPG